MYKKLLLSFLSLFLVLGACHFAFANKVNPDKQDEIRYYEKLKNCIPAKISNGSIMFQTYGRSNRMCTFEMKEKDPLTNKFISNCKVVAPLEETRMFAEKKINFINTLDRMSKTKNSSDIETLMNNMNFLLDYIKDVSDFANRYCQK